MNFHDRGVFSNFERARRARSKIAKNIDAMKLYCRPSEILDLSFVLCDV